MYYKTSVPDITPLSRSRKGCNKKLFPKEPLSVKIIIMSLADKDFSLPKLEEKILKFWEENQIFEKSLKKTKKGKPFTFYDGPPFATGLPHYGHILASTIKDVIPRYQTMNGR